MKLPESFLVTIGAVMGLVIAGCATQDPHTGFRDDLRHYEHLVQHAEYTDAGLSESDHVAVPRPLGLPATNEQGEIVYWELSLEQAIRAALANSQVMNELGGMLLRSPQTAQTLHGPSLTETDPRFGVAAALAAFDTELKGRLNFENNDRQINNRYLAGTHVLMQDRHDYEVALRKKSATGTEYILRHTVDYDANNAEGNQFPTSWDTALEAEVRHPLLRGAGLNFNRIAGPNGAPGAINGVVIARINTDISLTDLEVGLRNLVSNVENAYWDLYFAYRDLEAKRKARDASYGLYSLLNDPNVKRLAGAEDDKIEQAHEQYYRFEADVQNALTGRLVEGTRANGETSGGTFRGNGGVYVAERRLRLLLGVPLSDGRLIRPLDEPSLAKVLFDWDASVSESLTRRSELRRQRLTVRRREMELVASQNFLRPRMDAVALYRFRGLGHELLDPSSTASMDNAYGSLMGGDFQEWQLGLEFSMPLGFREGHAAIRNCQLALARERSVLKEQERQVLHDLGNAMADIERAYQVAMVNLKRHDAAKERCDALANKRKNRNRAANQDATQSIFFVNQELDAYQRLASAESDFFRSLVEYTLSVKNVHIEKGTWKTYHQVFLAEDLTAPNAAGEIVIPNGPIRTLPLPPPPAAGPAPGAPEPPPTPPPGGLAPQAGAPELPGRVLEAHVDSSGPREELPAAQPAVENAPPETDNWLMPPSLMAPTALEASLRG